jgi:hypothetical protein
VRRRRPSRNDRDAWAAVNLSTTYPHGWSCAGNAPALGALNPTRCLLGVPLGGPGHSHRGHIARTKGPCAATGAASRVTRPRRHRAADARCSTAAAAAEIGGPHLQPSVAGHVHDVGGDVMPCSRCQPSSAYRRRQHQDRRCTNSASPSISPLRRDHRPDPRPSVSEPRSGGPSVMASNSAAVTGLTWATTGSPSLARGPTAASPASASPHQVGARNTADSPVGPVRAPAWTVSSSGPLRSGSFGAPTTASASAQGTAQWLRQATRGGVLVEADDVGVDESVRVSWAAG